MVCDVMQHIMLQIVSLCMRLFSLRITMILNHLLILKFNIFFIKYLANNLKTVLINDHTINYFKSIWVLTVVHVCYHAYSRLFTFILYIYFYHELFFDARKYLSCSYLMGKSTRRTNRSIKSDSPSVEEGAQDSQSVGSLSNFESFESSLEIESTPINMSMDSNMKSAIESNSSEVGIYDNQHPVKKLELETMITVVNLVDEIYSVLKEDRKEKIKLVGQEFKDGFIKFIVANADTFKWLKQTIASLKQVPFLTVELIKAVNTVKITIKVPAREISEEELFKNIKRDNVQLDLKHWAILGDPKPIMRKDKSGKEVVVAMLLTIKIDEESLTAINLSDHPGRIFYGAFGLVEIRVIGQRNNMNEPATKKRMLSCKK